MNLQLEIGNSAADSVGDSVIALPPAQWCYAQFQKKPREVADWLAQKKERGACFRGTFGFWSYIGCRVLFEGTFVEMAEQDAANLTTMNVKCTHADGRNGLGFSLPFFDQMLCALWKFKAKHVTNSTIATWFGVHPKTIQTYLRKWCPLLGSTGRALVFIPSSQYLKDTQPDLMKDNGMANVVLAGDCTEVVTETVRKHILIQGQQYADKSHCSAAIGCSFTTTRGGTAVALDLALGRASEDQLTQIIAKYIQIDPDLELMYDKGCPHIRAYLPNFNNVLIPIFLRPSQGKDKFTDEEASHNRACATGRYVVEVSYMRVKLWGLISPVVAREDFHYLNDCWWWALGYNNLCYKLVR